MLGNVSDLPKQARVPIDAELGASTLHALARCSGTLHVAELRIRNGKIGVHDPMWFFARGALATGYRLFVAPECQVCAASCALDVGSRAGVEVHCMLEHRQGRLGAA